MGFFEKHGIVEKEEALLCTEGQMRCEQQHDYSGVPFLEA